MFEKVSGVYLFLKKGTIMFVARAVFLLYLSAFMVLQFSPAISVAAKYSYKNSEKLKPLIKWRNYGVDAFKEAHHGVIFAGNMRAGIICLMIGFIHILINILFLYMLMILKRCTL